MKKEIFFSLESLQDFMDNTAAFRREALLKKNKKILTTVNFDYNKKYQAIMP